MLKILGLIVIADGVWSLFHFLLKRKKKIRDSRKLYIAEQLVRVVRILVGICILLIC